MKTIIVDDPEGNLFDLEDWQAERALQKAAIDAMRRARQFGTEFVVWQDGKVKCLKPNETEVCEREGLENLERLNRKIAALQSPPTDNAFILNDKPTTPTLEK